MVMGLGDEAHGRELGLHEVMRGVPQWWGQCPYREMKVQELSLIKRRSTACLEENVHESHMVSLAHDLGTSQCRVAPHALAVKTEWWQVYQGKGQDHRTPGRRVRAQHPSIPEMLPPERSPLKECVRAFRSSTSWTWRKEVIGQAWKGSPISSSVRSCLFYSISWFQRW